MIRRAYIKDVPSIAKIINDCAEYGQMLHRSLSYLYEHVRDFHVIVEDGQVVGVCGLSVVWSNMAEVYALAVAPEYRGRGLGKRLVLACIVEAEELGIAKLMTLTYERAFFEKLGFTVLDRQQLPLKVWSECLRCSKNQACDEIAMVREVEGIDEILVSRPSAPPMDKYVVPVISSTRKPAADGVRARMDDAR